MAQETGACAPGPPGNLLKSSLGGPVGVDATLGRGVFAFETDFGLERDNQGGRANAYWQRWRAAGPSSSPVFFPAILGSARTGGNGKSRQNPDGSGTRIPKQSVVMPSVSFATSRR